MRKRTFRYNDYDIKKVNNEINSTVTLTEHQVNL